MKNITKRLVSIVCVLPLTILAADVKEQVQHRADQKFRLVMKQKAEVAIQEISDKDFLNLTTNFWCIVRKGKHMTQYMLLVFNNKKNGVSGTQICLPSFLILKVENLNFEWEKNEKDEYINGEWIHPSVFIRKKYRVDVFVKGGSLEFQIIKAKKGWGLVVEADEPVLWMKKTNLVE